MQVFFINIPSYLGFSPYPTQLIPFIFILSCFWMPCGLKPGKTVRWCKKWFTTYSALINRVIKDILGFYTASSEGANFWLEVLNDLKNRGVNDILIAYVDGLTGFPEAIQAAIPQTEVQLCVGHQNRQSICYVASKDQKLFLADLKHVYAADTKALAEEKMLELDDKWGQKYPMVLKSWQTKWDYLSAYFKYSKDVRCIIYTTNAIEGFHRQVRKYTKNKGAFST